MELLMDPQIWIGLLTLVVLEVVLGIDNLVFIAILADKLPPEQRDRARQIGLTLALLMRLLLLSVISWMVTLTQPLFSVLGWPVSGRDLILLAGGVFLLFKATTELHERLEGNTQHGSANVAYASFGVVVAQIVVLDAVFSLDAVITAVGMVQHLEVMMAAVVIAMSLMLLASKPLTAFVNAHPTVVILCLSFLLMIGFSLVAEGLGWHVPKGYIYAAIGFSILIEGFNQWSMRNSVRQQARLPLRERTADAILRLIGGRQRGASAPVAASGQGSHSDARHDEQPPAFREEERYMINGVLTLAERSVKAIMTPRANISWVDVEDDIDAVRRQILDTPHSLLPVCRGSLDEVIGVARAKDLLTAVQEHGHLRQFKPKTQPSVVLESVDIIKLLSVLRLAKGSLVLVNDEFGTVQGLVTPLDVLEAIAGEFPDEDETPDVIFDGRAWLVKGHTDLHQLDQVIEGAGFVDADSDSVSLAGLLLRWFGHLPSKGESVERLGLRFDVLEVAERRIALVRISRLKTAS
ncbi:TerC family protein [Amphibiibacter pelophylacis]|uniref:TerC family protein n=1 Tax=Amphibiibacter pelophylacis TaxID=1799477 RepID=A0ACC6P3D7_9BURK